MRPVFEWQIGSRSVQLGKRTLIMGVVNVTPDSFSDGGANFDRDRAVEYALTLLQDGADIIDVGGESTRPGAKVASVTETGVTEKEELERVIPVISGVKKKNPRAIISVDTYKAGVARAAVKAGAEIVNDVSGFLWDAQMRKTLAELKCGAVLMHMRGRPQEWKTLPPLSDVVTVVKRELRERSDAAVVAGMKRERMVIDPGFRFRQEPGRELSVVEAARGVPSASLPAAGGRVAKVLHWPRPGAQRDRRAGGRPAVRDPGGGNRGHHEGRPYYPHP